MPNSSNAWNAAKCSTPVSSKIWILKRASWKRDSCQLSGVRRQENQALSAEPSFTNFPDVLMATPTSFPLRRKNQWPQILRQETSDTPPPRSWPHYRLRVDATENTLAVP